MLFPQVKEALLEDLIFNILSPERLHHILLPGHEGLHQSFLKATGDSHSI